MAEKASKKGLTRRGFLRATGAVAGTTALGALAAPTLSALAAGAASSSTGEQVFVGRCTYPGCFACERDVVVRDGHVVHTKPRAEAPYGRRPCAKGYSLMQRLYAEDRTRYPLKRAEGTERGEGQWERISWDEALKTIGEKFKECQEQYGPYSLFVYSGPSCADLTNICLRTRLMGVLQTTTQENCADWAIYHGVHRVLGNPMSGNMTFPGHEPFEDDIFNAKNIVVWGKNPSNSYPQRWRYLLDAQDRGAKMYAVDPNVTQSVLRADKWFKVRPGSDAILMLSLMQVIFEEGLQDDEFIAAQTVAPYLVRSDNGKFLHMSDLGVAPLEGPPDMYGQPTFVDPAAVWDPASGAAVSCQLDCAPAIEGTFTVEGVEVSTALTVLKNHVKQFAPESVTDLVEMSPEEIRELAHICADGPVTYMFGMGFQHYDNGLHVGMALATLLAITGNMNKPGAGVANDAVSPALNVELLLPPTMTFANTVPLMMLPEIIKTGKYLGQDYPIKAALIMGSTAPMGNTAGSEFVEAFRELDFVVVQDVSLSNSARLLADIVLPAAHPFEREVLYFAALEKELPYAPKMVEPAFEARSDSQILIDIANAMGVGEMMPASEQEALDKVLNCEPYISRGITFESLSEKHTMRWADKGFLYEAGFPTATGKIEFYSENPLPRMELGLDYDVSKQHLAQAEVPFEAWPGTAEMTKYPLVFTYQRNHFRFHGTGPDGEWVNELEKEPVARVNSDDAEARGITDGELVEFYNDRGSVVMRTYICAGVRPGMVVYDSKGLRTDQYVSGDPATLMQNHMDPFAVNQSFFDCTAEMRSWSEGR